MIQDLLDVPGFEPRPPERSATCQLPDPENNFMHDHLYVVVRLLGDVVVVLGVDADGNAGGVHDLGRGRRRRLLVDVEVVAKEETQLT